MAEEKTTGKLGGWIKALLTSIVGLFSGAVLMYVSPLVNKAIKPGKPIANFSQQAQGLAVTFQNRASGGTDGWWDFGDGSALEPFAASQEAITHTYPRPGSYTAKLSLRNFLGDENERAVSVNLDGGAANAPVIEVFKVLPPQPDMKDITAPATFRLVAKVKNADLCIWSLGDDRPLDVSKDGSAYQRRVVTVKEAGQYTFRLVAVSGKQTVEKSETIWVNVGDDTVPAASLQMAYDAVQVERVKETWNMGARYPHDRKENTFNFRTELTKAGFVIIDAKFEEPIKSPLIKNPKLDFSDKTRVRLIGEMTKPAGFLGLQKNVPPPCWHTPVAVILERRSAPVTKTTDPVAANLAVPGTTTLLVPKLSDGWEVTGKPRLVLELRDGNKVVYRDAKLPSGVVIPFKNRPCRVTAVEGPDQIRLEIIDATATLGFVGS